MGSRAINDRNKSAYTCEHTVASIGGVHEASPAGTDRTDLRDTETCSALSQPHCTTREIASLCFFTFLPTCKMGCL